MEKFHYPTDLANTVNKYLQDKETSLKIDFKILSNLFEVMYFASLYTEESEPIRCTITFIDKEDPDPNPPKRIRSHRWTSIALEKEIEFNIQNLTKISKAANPRSASIAVYSKNNKLIIWGLIDQEDGFHDFIQKEKNSGPPRPGIFQSYINNLGQISVYDGYRLVAELKKSHVVSTQYDIFNSGPIALLLDNFVQKYIHSVNEALEIEIGQEVEWEERLGFFWHTVLCRILLNIQNFKHGGAILIDPTNSSNDLNKKYNITYRRLTELLKQYGKYRIETKHYRDKIINDYYSKQSETLPTKLQLNKSVSENELTDIEQGIKGCIKFISSLSCVDGLVLMDDNLTVNGFGVEIKTLEDPPHIYLCKDLHNPPLEKRELNLNHFGTRHRSMMRYCYNNPGSIGFVISQDGDIRVMIGSNEDLFIWDNIKLFYSRD